MSTNCRGAYVWLVAAAKKDIQDKEDTDLAEPIERSNCSLICASFLDSLKLSAGVNFGVNFVVGLGQYFIIECVLHY